MYAWGGDTSNWRGTRRYDFGAARADYDRIAAQRSGPRDYMAKTTPDLRLVNPRGKTISSESENPIIIGVDVTGSMATWPGEIFDRLPLLYQTLGKYRRGIDICFSAVGDAYSDNYPLQVNNFARGLELEKKLKALGCEGNGGGQGMESYELFGYFMLENTDLPNAKKPFLLLYGDEGFYDVVNPRQIEHYIGKKIGEEIPSNQIWQRINEKFNFYMLHKPYQEGSADRNIVRAWQDAIGPERVKILPSCDRAVDVGLGIIAKHWGQYEDFTQNLNARHDSEEAKKSVHTSVGNVEPDKEARIEVGYGSKLTKPLL